MKILLLIMICLTTLHIVADEIRSLTEFESQNGKYTIKQTDAEQGVWTLYKKSEKYKKTIKLYSIVDPLKSYSLAHELEYEPGVSTIYHGELTSKTVLISDDGRSIVAVDDFSETVSHPCYLLIFFRDGIHVKTYELKDLMKNYENVSNSVWHYFWYTKCSLYKQFDKNEISVETVEGMRYRFSIITGEILEKNSKYNLDSDSLFVCGKIKKLSDNNYRMDLYHIVHGILPESKKVDFTYKGKLIDGEYATLIIKNGMVTHHLQGSEGYFNYGNVHRMKKKKRTGTDAEK